MNKFAKTIARVLIPCVLIGGLGYGGYLFYESKQASTASASDKTSYMKVQIGTGNLEKTVTGTGTLSISKTENVKVSYPITITNVHVTTGEQVTAGDPLVDVDTDALGTVIASLESELMANNDSMIQMARSYSDESKLTISTAGRIKAVYGAVGDLVQDVMDQHGALALLSMDGKMNVTIPAADMTLGQTVEVYDGITKYTGLVEKIDEGTATITFSDEKTLDGASIQVVNNSIIVGTGIAQINMPFKYTTTAKGQISKVYYNLNGKPSRGSSLFYLINVPVSSEYAALEKKHNEIMAKLKEAKGVLASGTIVSPIDGIASSVASASETELPAGTVLVSLYAGDAKQMVVSVDELDIIGVKVGQEVTIEMDAITDKTYQAEVSYISQIGSSSSGVTTYSVTLDVQGDEQLKIGMNGTATIIVGDAEGVVLVPIIALNTSRGGQYVWLYNDSIGSDSDEPGVRTFVTTGLSNDSYAEVKTGLKAGDYVMVTRTASASESNNQMMGGMEIIQMPGGTGFTPPTGNDGNQNRSFPGGGSDGGGNRSFPGGGGQGGDRRTGN